MEKIHGGWRNVPGHLKTKNMLKALGLRPAADPVAEVWSGRVWASLYDQKDAVPLKAATDKQLEALAKARAAQELNRTCISCGEIVRRRNLLKQGVCPDCQEQQRFERIRQQAVQTMAGWLETKNEFVIVDIETTGLDSTDEIVEIAVVDLDERVVYQSLVKPQNPIPPAASLIHGITDEMVQRAPSWPQVWSEVTPILTGKKLLIYNYDFDLPFIMRECRRHLLPIKRLTCFCVMEHFARYNGDYSLRHQSFTWVSLSRAAEMMEVLPEKAHRAAADGITTARVTRRLADKLQTEEASQAIGGEIS